MTRVASGPGGLGSVVGFLDSCYTDGGGNGRSRGGGDAEQPRKKKKRGKPRSGGERQRKAQDAAPHGGAR